MLAKWTEILPLFVVRWLAAGACERMLLNHDQPQPLTVATARPGVLIVIQPKP